MDTFTIILKRFGGIIESVRDDEPIRASNLLPCEITLEVTLVQLPLLPFSYRNTDVATKVGVGFEFLTDVYPNNPNKVVIYHF